VPAAAVKLKKSAAPAWVTMPVALAVAVVPVTVGVSVVAEPMLLPLSAGTKPNLLAMMVTSSSCCKDNPGQGGKTAAASDNAG
jgi:hypothetical protein